MIKDGDVEEDVDGYTRMNRNKRANTQPEILQTLQLYTISKYRCTSKYNNQTI